MRSLIEEVGPTIVFFAAFESDQSVGPAFDQRCLSLPILEKWDVPRRIGRNMRFAMPRHAVEQPRPLIQDSDFRRVGTRLFPNCSAPTIGA